MIRALIARWQEIRQGFRPQPPREVFITVRVELDGNVLAETVKKALIRDARRNAMGCYLTDVDHTPPPARRMTIAEMEAAR